MLKFGAVIAALCLMAGVSAWADGISFTELPRRCKVEETTKSHGLHEARTMTMIASNEGRFCYLTEWFYQDGGGAFGNKAAFDNFTLVTPPNSGAIVYKSDSQSYIGSHESPHFV